MKLKNHGNFGLVSEEKRRRRRLDHDLSLGLCSSKKKERNVVCYFIIYYV
jgi:hypothetical protein